MRNKYLSRILFLLITVFCCENMRGQVLIDKYRLLGGTGNDISPKAISLSNGNFLIGFTTQSNDGDITGNHGGTDIALILLDSNLNTIWQKCYGGSRDDVFSNIFEISPGSYVIYGKTESNGGDVSFLKGISNIWLLHIDSAGNITYEKTIGSTGRDNIGHAVLTSDKKLFIMASPEYNDIDVPFAYNFERNFWQFNIDTLFNTITNNVVYDIGDWISFDLTALCSGKNQIVYATQTIGDVGDHYYVSDVFAELSGNKYLHYSLPGYDIHVQDIINTGDGYLLLAEHSWPVGDFPYGEYYVTSDAVIIRLDDSLKFIWSKTCAGSGRESFSSGVELDDCSFLVAGFSNSNDGDFGNKKKAIEPFILKISGLGKILSLDYPDGNLYPVGSQSLIKTTGDDFLYYGQTIPYYNFNLKSDIHVAKFDNKFNTMTGKLFLDANSNNVKDNGEKEINSSFVWLNQNTNLIPVHGNYSYSTALPGTTTSICDSLKYYSTSPPSNNATFLTDNGIDTLNDFAYQPVGIFNDAKISLTKLSCLVPGKKTIFNLHCTNIGTTTISPTISFNVYSTFGVTFVNASLPFDSIIGSTVWWTLDTIRPIEEINITIVIDATAQISDSIFCFVDCFVPGSDFDDQNNHVSTFYKVLQYCNEMEMMVNIDTLTSNVNSVYPELEYTISFQNTENYFWPNLNMVSYFDASKCEANSIQIIEQSHKVKPVIDANSWAIFFTFDSINLAPQNQNELMSCGYVKYKIAIKDSLAASNLISAIAFIGNEESQVYSTDHVNTYILPPCSVPPDSITYSGNTNKICNGQLTLYSGNGILSAVGSFIWHVDSCNGPVLGSGSTLYLTPKETHTYYLETVDTCSIFPCVSATIFVSDTPSIQLLSPTGVTSCGDSLPLTFSSNLPGSYSWQYEDGTFLNNLDDTIYATKTGIYYLWFTSDSGCTVYKGVNYEIYKVDSLLGTDSIFCRGSQLRIESIPSISNIIWNTGSTDYSTSVDSSGLYIVTVTHGNSCVITDSVNVKVLNPPTVNLGNDTSSCSPILLDAQNPGLQYYWDIGESTQSIFAHYTSPYIVYVRDSNGCIGSDTIEVEMYGSNLELGPNKTVCGATLLDAGSCDCSYLWNNGNTQNSILANVSGTYTVTVTSDSGCVIIDSISLIINPAVNVNLGIDTAICSNSHILNAQNAGATYIWQDGSTEQTYSVTNTDYYSVTVTNSYGCSSEDVVLVCLNSIPFTIDLGKDTTFCANSILLDAQNSGSNYLWSDGSTLQTLLATNAGTYSVTVTSPFGCYAYDTLVITHLPPYINLGSDNTTCDSILLDAQNPGSTFLWSDGSTNQTLMAYASGAYIVTVTNASLCENSDTINITLAPHPFINFGNDTTFCGSGILNANNAGSVYLWNGGQTTQTILVDSSSTYSVLVTNTDGCTASDSIVVSIYPLPQINFIAFVSDTICRNAGMQTINAAIPPGGIYYLNNSVYTSTTIDPNTLPAGINVISYQYTDSLGCKDSVSNNFWVDDCTAINSIGEISNINIIPNPASDYFTVHTSISNYSVKLFSAKGELVFEKSNCKNDTRVITKMYDAGLYSIQIIVERGTIALKVSVVKN